MRKIPANLCVGILVIAVLFIGARTAPFDAEIVREAIARSLPYLERDGSAWMSGEISIQDGKGCVSCHHVAFAQWSHNEASRAGIAIPETKLEKLRESAMVFLARPEKPRVMSLGPMILAHKDWENFGELRTLWQELLDSDLNPQQNDGRWQALGQFPGQNRNGDESDAVATMWTILVSSMLQLQDEINLERRTKALQWIRDFEGKSSEWFLVRFLVEKKFGVSEVADDLLQKILSQQNSDGGWSWLPEDESNAYSTGQSLYVLSAIIDDDVAGAIGRGVTYLLKTQADDGMWLVDSDLISEVGSKRKNYVYTYWGTAWAAIGLARTLQFCNGNLDHYYSDSD